MPDKERLGISTKRVLWDSLAGIIASRDNKLTIKNDEYFIEFVGQSTKLDIDKIYSFVEDDKYAEITKYIESICEDHLKHIKVSKINIEVVENGVKIFAIKCLPNDNAIAKEYVFNDNEDMFSVIRDILGDDNA